MNNRSATPNHHHWWQHRDRSGDTLVRDDPETTPPVDEVDLRETDRDTDDETVRPEPSRVERRQYATQAPAPPTVVREEVVSSVPTDSYWSAPFWGVERLGAMAIGAFFIVMGVLTFARGDLNGSWYRPVVEVFSFTHTPAVGGLEVIVGALLMLSALSARGAGLAAAVGMLTIVAGALVIAGEDPAKFHTEDNYGWMVVALGAGAVLFAVPGLGLRRRQEVRREVVRTTA